MTFFYVLTSKSKVVGCKKSETTVLISDILHKDSHMINATQMHTFFFKTNPDT